MKLNFRYPIFISLALIAVGCISSSYSTDEKRVALFFMVNNIGENIVSGEDTLRVDEFKFSLDRFILYAEGDLVLQTSNDVSALIFAYTEQNSGNRLILDVGLGFEDVTGFNGYEIFLEPVENRDTILDDDFFGESRNYSLVIKGQINGNDFTFNSSQSFEKLYQITDVVLDENNETLVIRKSINLNQVFFNNEAGIINPGNGSNEGLIINNIRENLIIEAAAETLNPS